MEVDVSLLTCSEAAPKSMVKFSIIVPVYNVRDFLQECLDSIKKQSLKDFEVICVNDGSTDDSLEILREYAEKDSRFKIFSQENQGQGVARNKGIEFSHGEYFLFVDPDDFIEPNTLEILYKEFQRTNVDMIQFDNATCKENEKKYCGSGTNSFKKRMYEKFKYHIKNNAIYNWHDTKITDLSAISLCAWDKAYRADFIKNNQIKFALYKVSEDNIFSISANLLADKILYLNKTLYHYRTRSGSSVNKASDNNFCVFDNIDLIKEFLVSNNLFNEYKSAFKKYVLYILCWHYALIPVESMDKYLDKCKCFLNPQEFALFKKKVKGNLSIMQKIFSIKNHREYGEKVKYLTILGIRIKIKGNTKK